MPPPSPQSTPSSDLLRMFFLVDAVWIGIILNPAIVLVDVPVHQKMGLVAEVDFFAVCSANYIIFPEY